MKPTREDMERARGIVIDLPCLGTDCNYKVALCPECMKAVDSIAQALADERERCKGIKWELGYEAGLQHGGEKERERAAKIAEYHCCDETKPQCDCGRRVAQAIRGGA